MNPVLEGVLNVLIAVLPAVIVMLYVYFNDNIKASISTLLLYFIFGLLSVIPALILETLAAHIGWGTSDSFFTTLTFAVLVVGLSEEFSKFIFLRLSYNRKQFNEPYDGILFAVMISMGFAALENVSYVLRSDESFITGISRFFTAVPMHGACAVIMGYWVGASKFSVGRNQVRYMYKGLILAVIVHGLYDFFLMQSNFAMLTLVSFIVLIVSVVWSIRAMNKQREISKQNKMSMDPFDNFNAHEFLKDKRKEK